MDDKKRIELLSLYAAREKWLKKQDEAMNELQAAQTKLFNISQATRVLLMYDNEDYEEMKSSIY